MKYKYNTNSKPMYNISEIKWVEIIDSTNNEIKRHMAGLDNLSVLAAKVQTAGRGQRGNKWLSDPGENLTFSIFLNLKDESFPLSRRFDLTVITTLAIVDYLKGEKINAKIKWPNDIYVHDKKICGILIENTANSGFLEFSVIGIGLNVNQTEFAPELMNPTSMKACDAADRNIEDELKKFMSVFEKYLNRHFDKKDDLYPEYTAALYRSDTYNKYVNYIDNKEFIGKIKGVTSSGLLVMEMYDKSTAEFAFKELGYII